MANTIHEKRANAIKTPFIVLSSGLVTLYFSTVAMLTAITAKGSRRREKTNTCIYRWSRALLRIINVKYTVHNAFEFEPNKKYVVMCNHNSLYDIPLSFMAINGTLRMVAKKELSRVPFLGKAMKMAEFIFIDRGNHVQALQDLEAAKKKMSEGIIIWICPEGRRSPDGKLLPLKQGGFIMALQMGATIVPMGIRGADRLLKPKSVRVLLNHHIDIYFGKPIDTAQYSLENRQQLIDDVTTELKIAANLH